MTRDERRLRRLLQVVGVLMLWALPAVFMPASWMAAIHRWLGLGALPDAPIVQNLARSLSAFYTIFGALFVLLAGDLQRYLPLVRFLGFAMALFGFVLIGIDLAAGMPLWWTVSEGLATVAIGAAMLLLSRRIE